MTAPVEQFKTPWTPERDAELTSLHAAGKSYAQMGAAMSMTRSAVGGRLKRLGLVKPSAPYRPRSETPRTPEARAKRLAAWKKRYRDKQAASGKMPTPRKLTRIINASGHIMRATGNIPQPKPKLVEVPTHTISFDDLAPGLCKWPFGESPFRYCGCAALPKDKGFDPYCSAHHAVAYKPWEPRVRRAA